MAVALLYSGSGAISAIRHAVKRGMGTPGGTTVCSSHGSRLTLSGELASSIGDRPWLAAVAQFAVTKVLPLALALRAKPRRAWLGALAAVGGILVVRFGMEAYFSVFGDSSAIYGTMGALLAAVFSAYLVALALILGAHVSAAAGRPEDDAGVLGGGVSSALLGLFVRRPETRDAS